MNFAPFTLAAVRSFALADWIVLAGYGLLLLITGWLVAHRKKNKNTADYFLAGRSMPAWAVTISFMATTLSAATFIGGPQQSYRGNLTYLSSNIGNIIAALIVAFLFIPAFYRKKVATVYELLDHRAGPAARIAASWSFMIGRVFASGSRLYIGSLAASLIVFGDIQSTHIACGILAFTIIGIFYTLVGGIASVIWTDVIQFIIFVAAALIAGIILLHRIPISFDQIMTALQHPNPHNPDAPSKLLLIDSGLSKHSINHTYTILSALFGFSLFGIAAYGTDQDLTQRMLTCKSARAGSKSMISAILLNLPVTILFMAIGLLLFIYYQRPDIMGSASPAYQIDDTRKIFLSFIIREMPAGLSGLMMAGLFAAGLSSLNSALNAMASTFTNDIYKTYKPNRTESHYLKIGKTALIIWGIIVGSFAIICIAWQQQGDTTLIDFALGVMVFAYSGLLGVFLTVLLTKSRGNTKSIIAALIAGFLITLAFQPVIRENVFPESWQNFNPAFPWRMLIASTISFMIAISARSENPVSNNNEN